MSTSLSCPRNVFPPGQNKSMQIALTLCCRPDLSAGKLWRVSTCFPSPCQRAHKQVSAGTQEKGAARAAFQRPSCPRLRAGGSCGSSRGQVTCTEPQTKTAPMNMQRGIYPMRQNWVPLAMCVFGWGRGSILSRNTRRQCEMSCHVSRLSLSLHIKSLAKSSTLIKLGGFALLNRNLKWFLFSRMSYVSM